MGMGAEMPGMQVRGLLVATVARVHSTGLLHLRYKPPLVPHPQGMHLPTDYYASMGHFAVPPYMYYNPVVASAYQAAYIAALAVGASQQQVAQAATPSAGASAPEAGATAAPQYIPPAWPMMAMQVGPGGGCACYILLLNPSHHEQPGFSVSVGSAHYLVAAC